LVFVFDPHRPTNHSERWLVTVLNRREYSTTGKPRESWTAWRERRKTDAGTIRTYRV